MQTKFKTLVLAMVMTMSALFTAGQMSVNPYANGNVTVKLVLGEGATLAGYTPSDDLSIYHRHVVTYTAAAESLLPQPQKQGTTFISWVFAQASALVRVNRMPKTSGAVYYAYWEGDGTLATSILSSSSSSSLPPSSTPSVPTSIYLKANQEPVDWPTDNAKLNVYFWEAPETIAWPGVTMISMGEGLYRYDFNFTPSKLLFVRLSSNGVDVWNQTDDLTYTAPNNLFTLTSWDNGEWSLYQPASSSSIASSSATPTSLDSSSENPDLSSSLTSLNESTNTSTSLPTSTSDSSNEASSVTGSSSTSSITGTSEPTSSEPPSSSEISQTPSSSSSTEPSSSEINDASSPVSSEPTTSLSSEVTLTFSIYLYVNHPNANWGEFGATFSIYYWGNSLDANPWPGKSLTGLGNGYYRYTFTEVEPTHLIFIRRNPTTGEVWNQTIDYEYPGANYLLTIDNWGDSFTSFQSVGFWTIYSV